MLTWLKGKLELKKYFRKKIELSELESCFDKVVGLEEVKASYRRFVNYHNWKIENKLALKPKIYIFSGVGSGRGRSIALLEEIFSLKRKVITGKVYNNPDFKEGELLMVADYFSAIPSYQETIINSLIGCKGFALAVFLIETKNDSQLLSARLSPYFSKVETIDFLAYSKNDLFKITERLLAQRKLFCDPKVFLDHLENPSVSDINRLIEMVLVDGLSQGWDLETDISDLVKEYLSCQKILSSKNQDASLAWEDLEEKIGLDEVKNRLKQEIAYEEIRKVRTSQGLAVLEQGGHLAFLGNSGVGKTMVARLYAKILRANHIIEKDKVVEVGRADLIGEYVGQTAPKIKAVFEQAEGGLLFIDEAYSLIPQSDRDFANEAIPTILQEMENRRGRVRVIFAGYSVLMRQFFNTNPGFLSRIDRQIEFEDYGVDDLLDIFQLFLTKYDYRSGKGVLELLRQDFETAICQKNFGNARYVRQLFENAVHNQSYRLTQELPSKKLTIHDLNTLKMQDLVAAIKDVSAKEVTTKMIGFRAES